MKTPTTKLSKQKYRPMPRKLALLAGVIGLTAATFTATVSASDLSQSFSFNVFEFKEKELYTLDKLSKEKTMQLSSVEQKVKAIVSEAEATKQSTEQIEKELEETKAHLDKLSDMFVNIDKYSPDSSGNAYAPGNCTFFVKQMRPDISSYWGNASSWYSNAAAQGWNVGSLPKKGAIATTTEGWAGHVAYVKSVSLDQQWVTITEMNYGGLYQMNTRTVPSSEFKYIYELN